MKINPVLRHVKEVTETTSIKELNELLNTKEWIAIATVDTAPITYVLGRIDLEEIEKLA